MAIQTVNVGTTPGDDTGDPARTAFIKLNSNFSDPENAASRLVGTLPDQVPVNSLLYAIPRVINFTSATGSVSLNSLDLAIGDRALVRKLNTAQGTVTITCTGHTFTRAALASVTLNSDGDFWLIEKVTATRFDLVDGYETGENASGNWRWLASGHVEMFGKTIVNQTFTPGQSEGANSSVGRPKLIPILHHYDSEAQFYSSLNASGSVLSSIKISLSSSYNAGGVIAHHGHANKGDNNTAAFSFGSTNAESVLINKVWIGRWYS